MSKVLSILNTQTYSANNEENDKDIVYVAL